MPTRDDTFGAITGESWVRVCRPWANVQDILPSRSESVAESVDIARRPCRIRFRWRDGITAEMRVKIGARILRIVSGPAELGRRRDAEIMCEEITTQGSAP